MAENTTQLIIDAICAQTLTGSQIAKKYSVSRQYVFQLAATLSIKPYRKPPKVYQAKKPKAPDGLKEQWGEYIVHKNNAKKKGIAFRLTFDEWWGIWKPFYGLRGTSSGSMCMCRHADIGAYEVGNVRIDFMENNSREYQFIKRQLKVFGDAVVWC